MDNKFVIFVLAICFLSPLGELGARDYDIKDYLNPNNPDRKAYIERYREIAIQEMERAGIPASIKLAQGILESGDGKSTLATKANNHFGMKCGNAWKGGTYYLQDDDYDSGGNLIKSCFRTYDKPEESYVAHSEFLRNPKKHYRYGPLFSLHIKDYKAWANGLKKAGYATNPRYPELLIGIIEANKLYQYDEMADFTPDFDGGAMPDVVGHVDREEVVLNNGVRMVRAAQGDTPSSLSGRFGVSVKRLSRYNELPGGKTTSFSEGEYVYLQSKRKRWRGKKKYHSVKGNETMYEISQRYGIRLKCLYKRNRMKRGTEPRKGEKIALRRRIKKKRSVKLRDAAANASKGDWPDKPFVGAVREKVNDFDMEERVDAYIKIMETSTTPTTPAPTTPPVTTPNPQPGQPSPPVTSPPTPPSPDGVYHLVVAGDTLYSLSRKYGVTVASIRELNGLPDNNIRLGQRLRIK